MSITSGFGSFKGKRRNNPTLGFNADRFEKAKLYFDNDPDEPNETSKTILIRVRGVYLRYKFSNSQRFYKFLDENKAFGLLEQFPENLIRNAEITEEYKENHSNKKNDENGLKLKDLLLPTQNGLIITYYSDLVSNAKYRIVEQTQFNRWVPIEQDCEIEYIDDRYSIEKNGSLIKNNKDFVGKVIGLRVYNHCLQIRFGFEWEFKRFIKDTKALGLVSGTARAYNSEEDDSSSAVSTSGGSGSGKAVKTEKKNDNDGADGNGSGSDESTGNEKKEEEPLELVYNWEDLECKDYRIVVNGSCDPFYTIDALPKRKKKAKSKSKAKNSSGATSTSTKSSFFGFSMS